jgi:hypothetical protein
MRSEDYRQRAEACREQARSLHGLTRQHWFDVAEQWESLASMTEAEPERSHHTRSPRLSTQNYGLTDSELNGTSRS